MRISRSCALLLSGAAVAASTLRPSVALGQVAEPRGAVVRSGPAPGIRFTSGLVVYDEGLYEGHWAGRYWTTTGQINPEDKFDVDPANDAFELGIEGQDLAGTWRWVGSTQKRVQHPDGLLVTFELASTARPITVRVHTLLTGRPVMVRWLEIVNTGSKPTAITRVSPWAGRLWAANDAPERRRNGETPFEVATTESVDFMSEGAWRFDTIGRQTKTVAATHGVSGWGHPTFFAHNRATGEWAVASLAWSAPWALRLTGGDQLTFELGPSAADPVLRVIDPGETVKSPETHLVLMRGDLDQVIQTLHEHVRRDVVPPPIKGREYQIESNHRGYIAGHEDEPGMLREIDIGAAVGTEMFVIDAGWYGPEPNDWGDNVGDWYAGKWLPHDLGPIRAYARKRGLLFGLWVEIEAVGAAAKLRAEHPDWVATRDGQPVAGGRQLDFSNPAVAAWAEAEIARVIQQYDLDMFRIDYNNPHSLGAGGNRKYQGFVENTEWRHVEALYAMFDRLRARFPHVIFQNCAAGGGRLDYGIMQRFHNTEISDRMRPPRGLKILNGVTWVLPPELLLRTFGTEVGELEQDGDLNFQLRHVMMSRPIFRGISPSVEELNPRMRQVVRSALTRFKRTVRPIMANSLVYHHTPVTPLDQPVPWVVLEYATVKGDRGVVGLFRTYQGGDSVFHLVPRGLDVSRTYRVHFGNSGRVAEVSGMDLAQNGLRVRLESMLTSELIIFEAK